MVIGLQIEKLHRGRGRIRPPPPVLDFKKPGLFRVKGKGAKAYLKDSYPGIEMFSVFCKVFEIILLRHLEKIAEEKGYFSHLQFVFKEGVSCLEASYVI